MLFKKYLSTGNTESSKVEEIFKISQINVESPGSQCKYFAGFLFFVVWENLDF